MRAAAIAPEQIRRDARFIEEDQARGIQRRRRALPASRAGGDVGPIVFGRGAPFFLTVKPSCFTARQMVARLAGVPKASLISASVRSGCAWINAASV